MLSLCVHKFCTNLVTYLLSLDSWGEIKENQKKEKNTHDKHQVFRIFRSCHWLPIFIHVCCMDVVQSGTPDWNKEVVSDGPAQSLYQKHFESRWPVVQIIFLLSNFDQWPSARRRFQEGWKTRLSRRCPCIVFREGTDDSDSTWKRIALALSRTPLTHPCFIV